MFNLPVILLASLVPSIVGIFYFNPKVFGAILKNESFNSSEKPNARKMLVGLFSTFVMGFFLSLSMQYIVIHQFHIYSTLMNDPTLMQPGSELNNYVSLFMEKYGKEFRTFKHGAFHGFLSSIMIVLPILSIFNIYENKSLKYVGVHYGYWAIVFILIGGIICQFA